MGTCMYNLGTVPMDPNRLETVPSQNKDDNGIETLETQDRQRGSAEGCAPGNDNA